jgi:uncharacterized membrane protein YccF (DUF307 family)
MRLILNILWLVLAGFWLFLGYVAAGVVWCITIIGIPFGIASFRIGFFALWPFGRTVVKKPTAGVGSAIGNVIWFIFSGLWLAIGHAVTGVLLCLTIIGIPLGLANFKLIPVSLLPLGRDIVPVDDVNAAWVQASVPPPPPGPPAVRG